MIFELDTKQQLLNDDTTIGLIDIDFIHPNICPVCHNETYWIKNKIEIIRDHKEIDCIKFDIIYKCDNCKDEQSLTFYIQTEERPRLQVCTDTKKSRKSFDDVNNIEFDSHHKYNKVTKKLPELIKLKKLPNEPKNAKQPIDSVKSES